MNQYKRDAMYVYLYAYIAGNITREVKNGNADHIPLPDTMDGFERNTTIEGRQQGICGDVTGNGVS